MHKIKIILLSLTGITSVFVATMVLVLCSYNNEDYRQLLINTVDKLTDHTLSIRGTFELHRSSVPVLSISGIELQSKIDASYVQIDNFRIQLTLASLLSNTLLINDLLLEDVYVVLVGKEPSSSVNLLSYLPIPVIEHAELKNIHLSFDKEGPIHTLESLVISAKDRQAPLELHGSGVVRGHVFDIQAQLGSMADVFAQQQLYPVNLTANWQQVQLFIKGTIADPAHGEGLDLVGKINVPEIADVYAANIPVKGHFKARAHIKGDFDELILAEIEASMANEQLIDLKLTGSIGDLLTYEQTELHLSGFIHDAALLKWVMPDSSPSFNKFNIETDISDDDQAYRLQNLNINLFNTKLKIDLTGNARIAQGEQLFRSLELQAEINSKDTETVKPYLGNILPEMGPVQGSVRITTQGKGFVLSNIDLLAGVDKDVQLTAKGGVGHLSIEPQGGISQIALALALKAGRSSELSSLLAIEHPEIGPVAISASLNGSTDELLLEDVKMKIGNPDVLTFLADGKISWDRLDTNSPRQFVDFMVHALSPSIQDAAHLYGRRIQDLGPAKASMRIHGMGSVLAGSDLTMQLGTENSLLLKVQGQIAQIFYVDFFFKGIEITGTYTSKSTSYLSKLLENSKIPDIGPLSGEFMVKGDESNLIIPKITLSAGRKSHLMLHASGKIANVPLRRQVPPQGVDIALTVTAPSSADLSEVVGDEIPDLGQLSIKGRFIDQNGIFAIKDLVLTAGNPKHPDISISGSVEDVLSINDVHMQVLFDEKTLVKIFDLRPIPELGKLKGSALLADEDGSLAIKELKLESGNSELIEFKINGVIADITNTTGINVKADISIKNPALFGKLFATDLSGLSPVSSSGIISGNKNRVKFKGNIFVGQTKLSSDLTLSLLKEKLKISGKINSLNLFLKDFGLVSEFSRSKASSQSVSAKSVKTTVFSDTPLALQALNTVDLDLQLRISRVSGMDYKLERVNIDLLLENGKLTANLVNFVFSEGDVKMNAEINVRGKPEWSLNIQGDDIRLGKVFQKQNKTSPLEGSLNLLVDLKSSGISEHEIASNLKGEVGFTLEDGSISRSNLELVFLNPLGWLFSHVISDNEIHISCGLARYQIKQGIVRSKVFLLDGPKLLIRGNAEINLGRETVNSLYNLEKKSIFTNTIIPTLIPKSVPIKVSGKMSDPIVEEAPKSSIRSRADRYIFAPVVTVPEELLGTVFDFFNANKNEHSPCQAYFQN